MVLGLVGVLSDEVVEPLSIPLGDAWNVMNEYLKQYVSQVSHLSSQTTAFCYLMHTFSHLIYINTPPWAF